MAAALESDIDSFIREHKAKLASERNALNQGRGEAPRPTWDKSAGRATKLAIQEEANKTAKDSEIKSPTIIPYNRAAEEMERKQLMEEQQKREYEEMKAKLDAKQAKARQRPEETKDELLFNKNEKQKDKAKQQLEYRKVLEQQILEKKQMQLQQVGKETQDRDSSKHQHQLTNTQGRRKWDIPETAEAEVPLAVGQYESVRKQKQKERQEEYRQYIQQQQKQTDRRSLVQQTDEFKAFAIPGMNESDSDKIQKERERNEEYKAYLAAKPLGRRGREEEKQADQEYFATLPGLKDSLSAKKRKEQERNQEYNRFLASKNMAARTDGRPPAAPRRGWATPTYDEMLDKKRQQETQYRRANDAGYDQPRELDRKLSELDKGLDIKKLHQERTAAGLLDDPEWLSPRRAASDDRQHHVMPQPQEAPRRESSFYATLPLGADKSRDVRSQPGPKSSNSEIQRSKERYRHELEQQIREAADGKRREKQQEMKVAYSALNGPLTGSGERSSNQKVDFGRGKPSDSAMKVDYGSGKPSDSAMKVDYGSYKQPDIVTLPASGRRVRNSHIEPYHSKILDSLAKLDQISPRSEVMLGRKRLDEVGVSSDLGLGRLNLSRGPSRGGPAILDAGFEGLLEAPRISSLAPPPGLQYQPASYITSGSSGLGLSSVDEAYNFYATRNPLDAFSLQGPSGGGGSGGGGTVGDGGGGRLRHNNAEQELSFGGGGGGGGGRTGRTPRVRFNEDARRLATGQMDFPTDEDKKREAQDKARTYQEELQQQIEEKNRKKFLEREEKERYERKLAQEALEYNPFGKGGGGAPMRDQYGNLVTDLRQMKRENDNPDYRGGARGTPAPVSSGRGGPPYQSPRGPSNVRDDLFGPPPVQTTGTGEQSFARGGHGIFGMPKTDAEKLASEKYKEDLKRQIETKKMEEMRKRELERQEEEQEMRRVEEQQARMKAEYEEEKRRTMEKEEEARRRNEELVRQAEERKREAERRRREDEDRRLEDQRREREAEINARLAEARAAGVTSPPVPAARRQASQDDLQPSTSKQDAAPLQRAASGDVLNQLALMRQQLQNERQRVENLLHHEKNEPDVFDPRLVQKPPHAPISKPEVDVFEMSRNRNAVQVRRTPADRANSQALEDFYSLRHKESSDSRKEFNRLFPEAPTSGDTLETQQAVLLQRQEETLRRLRDQRAYDSAYPKTSVMRSPSGTPQQLHSDSAFVDVDNLNHFPDDFDDIPASRRNDTARARRRNAGYSRRDSSPRLAGNGYTDPFGSTTSLNVDRLAKKNEERLRRLNEMKGDEISLYEADDVLDRFMSKQAHNRPPSGQTLQDDTWMFAGSKMSGY